MSQILNSAVEMIDETNSYEDEQSIAVSEIGYNINNNEVNVALPLVMYSPLLNRFSAKK